MTEFKEGDRVVVEAEVVFPGPNPGNTKVRLANDLGGSAGLAWVFTRDLELAPEPPYVDPELVPGMVVVPEDGEDDRSWWTQEGRAVDLWFVPVSIHDANRSRRDQLPERIRVVFDPWGVDE